ncbi:hypothetical protein [Balneatrix alpica]|uniref:hypothetical protein n=1 Tax=Balneatrix alpica TaxID=75684 RepID=UPI002739EC60|nr:hypothetical protein [Balneatrix alpica]
MTFFRVLTLSLAATLSLPSQANSPSNGNGPQQEAISQLGQLLQQLSEQVNWELFWQLQADVSRNWNLLVPYSQQYLHCVKQEGAWQGQNLSLNSLFSIYRQTQGSCGPILAELLSKMDLTTTEEDLDKGLSPELREQLKKSI